MFVKRLLVLLASSCVFLATPARAAEVAVMPVVGVNLSQGDCDAIGVVFANAFSRDARVAVASPLETKPLLAEGKTPAVIAETLGAARYVELRAHRTGERVSVTGILRSREGSVLFRADTAAWTLESMDVALTTLAQSLIWRQPIPAYPAGPAVATGAGEAYEAPTKTDAGPDPSETSRAFGPKVGLSVPKSSGRSFSPSFTIQFDGRLGPREYFLEFGAGLMMPLDESYGSTSIQASGGFLEIGGSHYLWAGSAAVYLGGGVSPAIWATERDGDSHLSATCGAYGQVGVTFTRDTRAKIYAEFRLTQLMLPVENPTGYTYDGPSGETFYPMVLSFQGGVGW